MTSSSTAEVMMPIAALLFEYPSLLSALIVRETAVAMHVRPVIIAALQPNSGNNPLHLPHV